VSRWKTERRGDCANLNTNTFVDISSLLKQCARPAEQTAEKICRNLKIKVMEDRRLFFKVELGINKQKF
jgi:hypothetical protein